MMPSWTWILAVLLVLGLVAVVGVGCWSVTRHHRKTSASGARWSWHRPTSGGPSSGCVCVAPNPCVNCVTGYKGEFPFSLGPIGDGGVLIGPDVNEALAIAFGSCDGVNLPIDNPSAGQSAMELMAFTAPLSGQLSQLCVSTRFQVADGVPEQLQVGVWTAPPTGPNFVPTSLSVDSPVIPALASTELYLTDLAHAVSVSQGDRVTVLAIATATGGDINLFRCSGSFVLSSS